MSYAIRSGIAITSTYALKQCGRLLKVSSILILTQRNFSALHANSDCFCCAVAGGEHDSVPPTVLDVDRTRIIVLLADRRQTVDGREKEELASLQLRLDSKIKVSYVRIMTCMHTEGPDCFASN
jgi:hypothetical protein